MSAAVGILKRIYQIIVDFFWPPPDPDAAYDEALKSYNIYQGTKKFDDLLDAAKKYEYALHLCRTSKDHTELASLLVNYVVVLWDCYKEEAGTTSEAKINLIQTAIAFGEEAHSIWKVDQPKRDRYPTLLTNLAKAYMELSRLDPNQAIAHLNKSISLNKEVYDNPAHYTAAFGIGEALWAHYSLNQFTDDINDQSLDIDAAKLMKLDEAITKFDESLAYASATNNAQTRTSCYYFLARAHNARYSLTEQQADLDAAVDYNRQARTMLEDGDPRLDTCLHDLCAQLLHKYDRDPRNRAPLQEAKGIAQGRFEDMMAVVRDREHRQATIP